MTTFVDSVTLFATAGKGGDGCVSVKREKFKPLGGPDGGNGGRGGDVILVVDPSVTTLLDFHHSPHRKATSGHQGYGDRKDGVSGEDLILPVPNGTVVYDESGEQLADLIGIGTTFLAARGGHGGLEILPSHHQSVAHQDLHFSANQEKNASSHFSSNQLQILLSLDSQAPENLH